MSGLGHFIEREGVPTAGISLVREHTESVRPPRALFVPFDFGLPFGAPHDPELQHRVLFALLQLFEHDRGPVFETFPDDDDENRRHADETTWSCPLPIATDSDVADGVDALQGAVSAEFQAMLPWYEHAVAERGRTTVGASGLDLSSLVPFIAAFRSTMPANPNAELPLALVLKAAVEDLKQVYLEAASARPDARAATQRQLNDWFWRETRAAELVRDVARTAQHSGDKNLDMVASMLLVPTAYL